MMGSVSAGISKADYESDSFICRHKVIPHARTDVLWRKGQKKASEAEITFTPTTNVTD